MGKRSDHMISPMLKGEILHHHRLFSRLFSPKTGSKQPLGSIPEVLLMDILEGGEGGKKRGRERPNLEYFCLSLIYSRYISKTISRNEI